MTEPQAELQISDEVIEAGANALASSSFVAGDVFDIAHCILRAAVPLLRKQWEAELRARIGEDIEAERSDDDEWEYAMGLLKAAAIARGGGYDPALDGPGGAQPGGQP